jgi:hypothetical protein
MALIIIAIIPMIADAAKSYLSEESVTKAIPAATPISPAIKLTSRSILLRIIGVRSESVRFTRYTKRNAADNGDIIQAMVTNARETSILLHAVRNSGVSLEHVNWKS